MAEKKKGNGCLTCGGIGCVGCGVVFLPALAAVPSVVLVPLAEKAMPNLAKDKPLIEKIGLAKDLLATWGTIGLASMILLVEKLANIDIDRLIWFLLASASVSLVSAAELNDRIKAKKQIVS